MKKLLLFSLLACSASSFSMEWKQYVSKAINGAKIAGGVFCGYKALKYGKNIMWYSPKYTDATAATQFIKGKIKFVSHPVWDPVGLLCWGYASCHLTRSGVDKFMGANYSKEKYAAAKKYLLNLYKNLQKNIPAYVKDLA